MTDKLGNLSYSLPLILTNYLTTKLVLSELLQAKNSHRYTELASKTMRVRICFQSRLIIPQRLSLTNQINFRSHILLLIDLLPDHPGWNYLNAPPHKVYYLHFLRLLRQNYSARQYHQKYG